MTYKLCQNANFKNGGTTFQMGILLVLLNILPLSILSRVQDRDAKSVVMPFYILKKMKKVNKQCLLDTPCTVRVSEKNLASIVQTRRP